MAKLKRIKKKFIEELLCARASTYIIIIIQKNVSANFIITHYRLHVKIAHRIIDDLHTKTQLPDTPHI